MIVTGIREARSETFKSFFNNTNTLLNIKLPKKYQQMSVIVAETFLKITSLSQYASLVI